MRQAHYRQVVAPSTIPAVGSCHAAKTNVGVDTPQMEAFRDLMPRAGRTRPPPGSDLREEADLSIAEYVVLLTLRYAPEGSLPVGTSPARSI